MKPGLPTIPSPGCRGFSLVEIMVSMVIGLFIAGSAVMLFQANKISYRFVQQQGRLEEDAFFAADHIKRILRMEGYRGDDPAQWVLGPLTQSDNVTVITGVNDDADNGNLVKDGTDTLTVVYEGSDDGFIKDCQGNTVAAGVQVSNTFAITTDESLSCSIDGGTTFVALVDGAENMQILFGEDTDNDQIPNRYVTATDVSDPDDVIAVRIALLLRSTEDFLRDTPDQNTYVLLDKQVYGPGNYADDRRIRRLLTSTIKLRNRL